MITIEKMLVPLRGKSATEQFKDSRIVCIRKCGAPLIFRGTEVVAATSYSELHRVFIIELSERYVMERWPVAVAHELGHIRELFLVFGSNIQTWPDYISRSNTVLFPRPESFYDAFADAWLLEKENRNYVCDIVTRLYQSGTGELQIPLLTTDVFRTAER